MFPLKQGIRKSLSVAAVFLVLAWTQANAWADEILVSAAASLTDVLRKSALSREPCPSRFTIACRR